MTDVTALNSPSNSPSPLILTVPGLNGSGPGHWQSLWEQDLPDCARADLGMWSAPRRNVWVAKLDDAIRRAGRPVILVAHSLGCHAVAWWASWTGQPYGWPVAGALLVAPPDLSKIELDARLLDFAPTPLGPLPFPSIVIGSDNDPYASRDSLEHMARYWESAFVSVGDSGHINAESDLGWWVEGQALLSRLIHITASSGSTVSRAELTQQIRAPSTPIAHRVEF